jgi:intraflagellar transport protein 122
MDSPIRYLKLIGGPSNYEAVLIGLKNGGVYQVFVNNPFPQFLAKQTGVIYCVDMNIDRTKLAIIDDTLTLYVYDIRTKELIYQVKEDEKINRKNSYFLFCLKGTKCTNSRMEYIIS